MNGSIPTAAPRGGHTTTTGSGIAPVAPNAVVAPELLTLQQAAELCNVSDRTLWTWATTGISPAPLRIGKGTVRYSRAAYVAWIAGGCKPVNGGPGDAK